MVIFTIGHSNRDQATFLALLSAHGVGAVADVRRFPGSRKHPHFGGEAMATWLAEAGIDYHVMPALGGRRRSPPGPSPNGAWRNPSFRAYADHMQTPEFEAGLQKLLAIAAERPTALMCSEAVPWRCHRSLIADALVARGIPVLDIFSGSRATAHKLPPFARQRGHMVFYPDLPPGVGDGVST